jgi:hypothetical protein
MLAQLGRCASSSFMRRGASDASCFAPLGSKPIPLSGEVTGMDQRNKVVVKAFVHHLAANGHEGLTVDSWPDEVERNAAAIDATAGPFAIEHTSIDTLEGQREADAGFVQSIGCLEKELHVPFHLGIFVKWGAITKGQNYTATREAVRRWILEDSPQLPY